MEKKYKINLHILEACNFRCLQCFSKFGTEKLLPVTDWMKIVDNCLAGADVSEFNIAGGEPMLYPGLVELAKYIRSKGVKVSLITNGSLMDESWIKNYAGLYETIGFSVDSINDETNRKIGRCDRNGNTILAGRIVELCGLIRRYAPECRIKINTVVSALNKDEVMCDFIDEIAADRWKILRMKPFQYGSFSNLDIQVSNEEFEEFVERNEVSTPMRCIAPIKVVSKTEQSSEKYLQELPIKGFVFEAVPLSSLEHKTNEPYAGRANKGLFTKPTIHWQMMPKEYFGLCFAFKARA